MAQTANSQHSQILQVESEQTLSTQSKMLPMQLNTEKDLIPNSSESPQTLQMANSWPGVFQALHCFSSSVFSFLLFDVGNGGAIFGSVVVVCSPPLFTVQACKYLTR